MDKDVKKSVWMLVLADAPYENDRQSFNRTEYNIAVYFVYI